jgi:murein DD-endopeptidase MepM/ murein hydrolase activator NlpD
VVATDHRHLGRARDAGLRGRLRHNVQVQVGDLWVRYAHLEAVLVNDGDQVAPGTVLGREGSTGFSIGPYLHFEVDRAALTHSSEFRQHVRHGRSTRRRLATPGLPACHPAAVRAGRKGHR